MRAREKIVYLLFLCMACMVSSCGDNGKEDWESEREEISQSRFSLSPPEWLIGTWQDGTGLITLQCTENNIIYGTDMASIDFVRYAEETSKFYEQDPSIGKVVLRDEFKGDSWYHIYPNGCRERDIRKGGEAFLHRDRGKHGRL